MNDYFETRKRRLDDHLAEVAATAAMPAVLQGPVRAAIESPGKRLRGLLTIAAGEMFGARLDALLDAAAAFEMIHASSLVLDDLPSFDDATLRRGRPALHRAFDENLAVLAAVALLNHAYGLVGRAHERSRPRKWPLARLTERVVAAVGWDGTIGGEAVDLHSEEAQLDFATLEYIHSRKTGALFVAAAAAGVILANRGAEDVQRMEAFAKNLGLAFQITDDILDVTATREELGKDVGKDEERLTFVKLAGLEGARQLAGELIETSISALRPYGSKGSELIALAEMVRHRTR